MKKTILIAFVVTGISVFSQAAQITEFIPVLEKLEEQKFEPFSSKPTEEDIRGWKIESNDNDPNVSLPALCRLWLAGLDGVDVNLDWELAWWRGGRTPDFRRLFSISTFEGMTPEPIDWKPPFKDYSQRFKPDEAAGRLAEYEYVVKNRAKIAHLLATMARRIPKNLMTPDLENTLSQYYEKTANSR